MSRVTRIRSLALTGLLFGAANTALALSFGEPVVRSALGEKLIVEIPLQAEALTPTSCFSINGSGYTPGLYRIERLPNALLVRSTQTVREPLLSFTLRSQCAGEVQLTRQYDIFVDPASRLSEIDRLVGVTAVVTTRATLQDLPVRETRAIARTSQRPDIDGNEYRVVPGDTLWEIAQRSGVPVTERWSWIDKTVARNPDAFAGGNADRLQSGAWLILPARAGSNSPVVRTTITEPAMPPTALEASAPATETSVNVEAASTQVTVIDGTVDAQRTAALLNVLNQADSPFKQPEASEPVDIDIETALIAAAAQSAAQTEVAIDSTSETISQQQSGLSWGARIGALLAGMCLTIGAYVGAQLVLGIRARRRRLAAARALQPQSRPVPARTENAPIPTAARPADGSGLRPEATAAATASTAVGTDDGAQFEATDRFATIEYEFTPSDAVALDLDLDAPDLAVGTLDPHDAGHLEWMDSDTQELLEQDYEEEFTRTQQIRKDLAEKALRMEAAAQAIQSAATVNMPASEADTVNMPLEAFDIDGEALELADAAIAEFTASLTIADDLDAAADSQQTASLNLADTESGEDDDETEVMPPARRA